MAIPTITGAQMRRLAPTVVTYAILAVVGYLLYRFVKKGLINVTQGVGDFLNTDAEEQLNSSEAADGTSMTDVEVQQFKTTARQMADGQENALYTTSLGGILNNPDEDAIFQPLLEYNGAQLREIYREYGQRRGKTLFEAYQNKLDGDVFNSLVYYDDRVVGCESYVDNCYEVQFARAIWQKSGVPISF